MRHFIIKVALLPIILILTACSHWGSESRIHASSAANAALIRTFSQLEQAAMMQHHFQYQLNKDIYHAYANAGKIDYIKKQADDDIIKIFYQDGKVYGVQERSGSYEFDASGKLVAAWNSNGKTANLSQRQRLEKQNELSAIAKKWAIMLGSNTADRDVGLIRTGDNAKLNYLCIAKIQQVASTKRVFRHSANKANSAARLTADVRLNGNQYYHMDCQLQGERVASLSLVSQ